MCIYLLSILWLSICTMLEYIIGTGWTIYPPLSSNSIYLNSIGIMLLLLILYLNIIISVFS